MAHFFVMVLVLESCTQRKLYQNSFFKFLERKSCTKLITPDYGNFKQQQRVTVKNIFSVQLFKFLFSNPLAG